MKKQFIKFSAITLTAVVMAMNMSCNDKKEPIDDPEDDNPVFTVMPSTRSITFSANGLTATPNVTTFTVTTDMESWDAESSQKSWLAVTMNKLQNTFTLSVSENTELEPRTATVTITSGTFEPEIINVTQAMPVLIAVEEIAVTGTPELVGGTLYLELEQNATLTTKLLPENFSEPGDNTLNWESSNTAVASVTQDGVVTSVAKGNAVITVSLARKENIKTDIPVTVGTWEEITSDVLTNYAMPFKSMEEPIVDQGNMWNYDIDGGWLYNTAGGANGVVYNNGGGYNNTLTMSAWDANCKCFPSTFIDNGKLYQTVTLEAGMYRFSAYVFAFWGLGSEISSTSFLVAASGSDLPDMTDTGNSLAYLELPFHCGDDGGDYFPEPFTIEFSLATSGPVSLGFVGFFKDAEIHFSKVELWSLK